MRCGNLKVYSRMNFFMLRTNHTITYTYRLKVILIKSYQSVTFAFHFFEAAFIAFGFSVDVFKNLHTSLLQIGL